MRCKVTPARRLPLLNTSYLYKKKACYTQRHSMPSWRCRMDESTPTRRDVLKTALYVTPVILTLAAAPSFAQAGSGSTRRAKHWPHPIHEGDLLADAEEDED